MHQPTDRIAHTTAFVTPVVVHWLEREIAQYLQCFISIYLDVVPTSFSFQSVSGDTKFCFCFY